MSQTTTTKTVACPTCKQKRNIRSDSTAKFCRACASSIGGKAPKPSRITGTYRQCLRCSTRFWNYLSTNKRCCSTQCANDCKRRYPKETRHCLECSKPFLVNEKPFSNSSGRFCSRNCCWSWMRTGATVLYVPTAEAASAMYHVKKAISDGALVRPTMCEQCGVNGTKIEAAHFDYAKKLKIRWLCQRCHRSWDSAQPKGGARRIKLR